MLEWMLLNITSVFEEVQSSTGLPKGLFIYKRLPKGTIKSVFEEYKINYSL